jgi:hypothetical protein
MPEKTRAKKGEKPRQTKKIPRNWHGMAEAIQMALNLYRIKIPGQIIRKNSPKTI